VSELFERFLRDGGELDVFTSGDYDPPGTASLRRDWPVADEALEWQTLFDAIADADGRLTMLELGAGYGRWTVYAAAVIRRYRPELKYLLVAVEAEPTHFRWLKRHTRANGLLRGSRAGSCRLVEAAVSRASGRDSFYVGDPSAWYGQAVVRPENAGADAAVRQVR